MYAFTQVAIYGKTYCHAAKDTWKLCKERGVGMRSPQRKRKKKKEKERKRKKKKEKERKRKKKKEKEMQVFFHGIL
jgi:hypothetical protein